MMNILLKLIKILIYLDDCIFNTSDNMLNIFNFNNYYLSKNLYPLLIVL